MKHTLAWLFVPLLAGALSAQDVPDTVRLKEIVVTATRLPTERHVVPASVTVIEGAELRRRGIRTVDEALRTVSSAVVVESGSYGATTSLFMRGGESDYVQVLIDGIQVNSPGEQFNWASLAVEDIERIEVVKGPASVLYGSDAVAGVVQLFTKQGSGKPRGELTVAAGRGDKVGAQAEGAFDNTNIKAELAGSSPRFGYSAGVSHFASEGAYAFNNRHRNTSLTARAAFQADARTRLTGSMRYGDNRFHYPTDGAGQLSDRNQFYSGTTIATGLDFARQFSTRLEGIALFSHSRNDDATDDRADTPEDTLGFFRFRSDDRFQRDAADFRLNYRLGRGSTLTAGTELEWQSYQSSSASPFGDAPEATFERDNRAAYAQWLGDYGSISVQAGVRAEDNDKFGNIGTYRGGFSARVSRAVRARVSAGTGFKEPRFFEQFAQGFVKGNPDLRPEHSRSAELALDVSLGQGSVTAAYFSQKFKDLIQYVGVPAQLDDPNYSNLAAALAHGFELEAAWPVSGLMLKGSYSRLVTRVVDQGTDDDASFLEGEPLLRRPRHSGSLGVTGNLDRLSLYVGANYVGERADLDFSTFPFNRITLPSYTNVSVSANYPLGGFATATLKIENALDQDYEEVHNFPARGRVSYVGVRLRL